MKIELIEIYKEKTNNKNFIGTAHVYLIDYEMDLRGIGVFKGNKGYYCKLPYRYSVDPETKNVVGYPVINFTNIAKQKELNNMILAVVKAKMEEKND